MQCQSLDDKGDKMTRKTACRTNLEREEYLLMEATLGRPVHILKAWKEGHKGKDGAEFCSLSAQEKYGTIKERAAEEEQRWLAEQQSRNKERADMNERLKLLENQVQGATSCFVSVREYCVVPNARPAPLLLSISSVPHRHSLRGEELGSEALVGGDKERKEACGGGDEALGGGDEELDGGDEELEDPCGDAVFRNPRQWRQYSAAMQVRVVVSTAAMPVRGIREWARRRGERLPDGVTGNDGLTRRSGVLVAAVRRSAAAARRHTMQALASWNVSRTWAPPSAALGSPAIGRCWNSTMEAVVAPTIARCWHSTRRCAAYARTLQATGSDFRQFSSLPISRVLAFCCII
ncbi:uncharacterized protein [Triticum aestivum]|uniref:uncharacterized protein n=1 Tax=Triticum aestivum TaxID=4565 RepID=UPI001D025B6B|nr:uncharacterized protein LOC123157698 [Triticum aestivum]